MGMFNFFKSKTENLKLVLDAKDEYKLILSSLLAPLRNSECFGQANVIENLIETIDQNNIEKFITAVNSVDMWGGSGAVWEVYIKNEEGYNKFKRGILQLIELLEQTKIATYRSKSLKGVFSKTFEENKGS